MKISKYLTRCSLIGLALIPFLAPIFSVKAQYVGQGLIVDPPSNVRVVPNGQILCSIGSPVTINIYQTVNGWYETDACGSIGYIHPSQVRLQSNVSQPSSGQCEVVGIQTGQLALRFTPGGDSKAGLNNGNMVSVLEQRDIWFFVTVIQGPNSQVTGLQGWVNSNYLYCY